MPAEWAQMMYNAYMKHKLLLAMVGGLIFFGVMFVLLRGGAGATVRVGRATVRVELALTPEMWARGLSGRASLAPDHGMLFVFPSPSQQMFWMKDMLIPLDIIWIREARVTGVAELAKPPTVTGGVVQEFVSPGLVDQVLEVPAGFARHEDIKVGDLVEVRYNK